MSEGDEAAGRVGDTVDRALLWVVLLASAGGGGSLRAMQRKLG